MEITRDEPVYIKDGYVTICYQDFIIHQKVKQIKGSGTSDADKLTKLNFYHTDIIKMMLKNGQNIMEGLTIRKMVKRNYEGEFKDNNWMIPISELFRKGILLKHGKNGNSIIYRINREKAITAINTGLFEVGHNTDIAMDQIEKHHKELSTLI